MPSCYPAPRYPVSVSPESNPSGDRVVSDRTVLLGTGTCQLLEERRASSVLVETSGLRVVYDLGRGIADRLAHLGLRQDDVRHVVFSHFHPDHVSDLIPFLQAGSWSRIDPRSEDLHLWGPMGLEAQMHRLLGLFPADHLTRRSWRVQLHELRDDELERDADGLPGFEIEGVRFGWPDLPPADNHGLVFDASLAGRRQRIVLTGDSLLHDALIAALRDCNVAVFDSGHLTDDEIVELMVRSRVPRLVASHVYREFDVESLLGRARARGFDGSLEMGRDLMDLATGGRLG